MATPDRFYSCDDHLDLWVLPPGLWQARMPRALQERAPRVIEKDGYRWWSCDGAILGPSGGALVFDSLPLTLAGEPGGTVFRFTLPADAASAASRQAGQVQARSADAESTEESRT